MRAATCAVAPLGGESGPTAPAAGRVPAQGRPPGRQRALVGLLLLRRRAAGLQAEGPPLPGCLSLGLRPVAHARAADRE